MQMAKTTAAVTQLAHHQLPFITLLTDPTMGGVSASFAFVGDVVIDARYAYSRLDTELLGDTNAGNATAALGYRFEL